MSSLSKSTFALALAAIVFLIAPLPALAHCDAEDGPLIIEARAALAKGDVTPMLKWVAPKDEAEIRQLFTKVTAVRASGDTAKSVADQLFLETLVRLHRTSEGEPFDGIKPAGQIEPLVVMIDKALAAGEGAALADKITNHIRGEIVARYEKVTKAAAVKDSSVEAGRAFVAAYVDYVHFIKAVHAPVEAGAGHAHAHGGAK